VDACRIVVEPSQFAEGSEMRSISQMRSIVQLRARTLTMLAAAVVAACSSLTPTTAPSSAATRSDSVSTLPSTTTARPTSTAGLTATESPTLIARCGRNGDSAFPGVLESRPNGWSVEGEIAAIPHFPNTFGQVYGPDGAVVPPYEGPGRIVLYETIPGSDAYYKSRIESSGKRNGKPIAVAVCGEATKVWLDEATGQLFVGWTDRNKSDVLVANTADFTVLELVESAESVSDCCG
jgi:hypothetical protein